MRSREITVVLLFIFRWGCSTMGRYSWLVTWPCCRFPYWRVSSLNQLMKLENTQKISVNYAVSKVFRFCDVNTICSVSLYVKRRVFEQYFLFLMECFHQGHLSPVFFSRWVQYWGLGPPIGVCNKDRLGETQSVVCMPYP